MLVPLPVRRSCGGLSRPDRRGLIAAGSCLRVGPARTPGAFGHRRSMKSSTFHRTPSSRPGPALPSRVPSLSPLIHVFTSQASHTACFPCGGHAAIYDPSVECRLGALPHLPRPLASFWLLCLPLTLSGLICLFVCCP